MTVELYATYWQWVSNAICNYISLGLGQKAEVVYLIGCIEERALDYTGCLGQRQLLTTHGSLKHLEEATMNILDALVTIRAART